MEPLICTIVLRDINENQEIIRRGDLVGVDAGALYLALRGYEMSLAIGDFDSIQPRDLGLVEMSSKKTVKLDSDKDESDFEAALGYLNDYDEIYIYGGFGGRQDHQFALVKRVKMDGRLRLVSDYNLVYRLETGIHTIKKESYQYLSLFALEPTLVSLEGTKYPLSYHVIEEDEPSYTLSNEILEDEAKLSIMTGRVLVIQSSDKKSYASIAD